MSNLPPGVTQRDIDRHFGGSDHDHRFEEPDEEFFEDGAFIVQSRCNHSPIYGSVTCDRLDETFYDEGPRCEVTQSVRMDASAVEQQLVNGDWRAKPVAESEGGNVFHEQYGDDTAPLDDVFIEEIEALLAREVTEEDHHARVDYNVESEVVAVDADLHERTVTVDGRGNEYLGGVFRVTYDNVEITVDH